MLEIVRREKVKRMHHISTCEVFGSLELDSDEVFHEDSPMFPNTPYNSAKACADLAVRAYRKTYGIPVTSSNCSNNYGPYQFIEKLIPLFITNLLQDKPITLYKTSQNKREWLYVEDHCTAIEKILLEGEIGRNYNIGSGEEKSIEDIADYVLTRLGKSTEYKTYIPDRPSHDARYLLDSSRIRNELGWLPKTSFETGMEKTISWYIENQEWWKPLLNKSLVNEMNWK